MPASSIILYGAILYGAEAKPRQRLPLAERLRYAARRKFHSYHDVARFRQGDLSRLDFRNYEGWDAINLGDVAISQATAALIKRALPETGIEPLNWGELNRHPAKESHRHKPLLIFNGSGYFFLNPNGRLSPRIKDDLDYLIQQAIPVFFFGVGLNQPGQKDFVPPDRFHPEDAEIVARLLDYAQAVSVRDAATQAILSPLTSKPIQLLSDPALHFHQAMGIEAPANAPRTLHNSANTPLLIGLNFSFHGANSTALLKKNLEGYCSVLLKLQKDTGAEFCYFVHYKTEEVLPRLLAQRGIQVKKVCAGDTVALARGYGELDLHIGGMLHSCILAASAGTPCLALAYDIKHQGFFDLMDMPENCLSAANFNPDMLYARAMDLLANPAPMRARIAVRRKALETETLGFLRSQLLAP